MIETNLEHLNELQQAAEAAEDIGMEHPECPNGHGLMLFFEGEWEQIDEAHGLYLVGPKFYCADDECFEDVVIS